MEASWLHEIMAAMEVANDEFAASTE
jgi:hypothetical protein